MPRRIVVRVANAASVSAPRLAAHCTRRAIKQAGPYGVPDVVLLSEVSPVNVARLAMIHAVGSEVVQYGPAGSPEAGVAIVSRLPVRRRSMARGSARTSEGGGIRMRPLVGAKIGGLWFWSGHAPPPRSPIARAVYIARARTRRGVVGCDWNRLPAWMRRMSRRLYRGLGVLGALIPRRFKASKAKPVDIGSDHDAVDFVLTRRGRRDRA